MRSKVEPRTREDSPYYGTDEVHSLWNSWFFTTDLTSAYSTIGTSSSSWSLALFRTIVVPTIEELPYFFPETSVSSKRSEIMFKGIISSIMNNSIGEQSTFLPSFSSVKTTRDYTSTFMWIIKYNYIKLWANLSLYRGHTRPNPTQTINLKILLGFYSTPNIIRIV